MTTSIDNPAEFLRESSEMREARLLAEYQKFLAAPECIICRRVDEDCKQVKAGEYEYAICPSCLARHSELGDLLDDLEHYYILARRAGKH